MATANQIETQQFRFPIQCMNDCSVIAENVRSLEDKHREDDARFAIGILGDLVETTDSHVRPRENECPFAFVDRLLAMSTDTLEGEARVAFHDEDKTQQLTVIDRIARYRYEQAVSNGEGMAVRQGWAWLVNVMDHPEAYLSNTRPEPAVRVLPWADKQVAKTPS